MKNYYECPAKIDPFIFLAGTISNSGNWQKTASEILLQKYNVINPRRANFDITDEKMTEEQIKWEHDMLTFAPNILFYFSHETVAPITLLEYGWLIENPNKTLLVCVHPDYPRKIDVIEQTKLKNPKIQITISASIADFCRTLIQN